MKAKWIESNTVLPQIEPLWEALSLRLLTIDPHEDNKRLLQEILDLLDQLQITFDLAQAPVGVKTMTAIQRFLSKIVSNDMDYCLGVSYILNFYELLDEAFDCLLFQKDSQAFEKKLLFFLEVFEENTLDFTAGLAATGIATPSLLAKEPNGAANYFQDHWLLYWDVLYAEFL